MTAAGEARPAEAIALLVEVLAVAGRRLRQLRRAPGRLLGVTLSPLISMVVLGYLFRNTIAVSGNGSYQEYLFAGAAIQVGLAGVGPTALAVATDLTSGLVDRFRSLPIHRSAVLSGHTVADLLVGLMSLGIVGIVGVLLGWRPHSGIGGILSGFALVVVFVYVMLWVGVLFGMVMSNVESIGSVTQFVVVVLPFFSNAFLPAQSFPALIRPIAEWNPISAVMTTCRKLWGNDVIVGSGALTGWLTVVVIVSMVLLLVVSALVSLRRFTTTTS